MLITNSFIIGHDEGTGFNRVNWIFCSLAFGMNGVSTFFCNFASERNDYYGPDFDHQKVIWPFFQGTVNWISKRR